MRKIFLFVCVLFTVASSAQVKQTYNQYGGLWNRLALKDSGALQLPRKPMGIKDFNGGLDTAQLMYRISDSAVLVWTGSQWRAIGGGATYTAGYGLFLTGTVFSLDSATAALTFLRRKDSATASFLNGYLTRTSVLPYLPSTPGLQDVITQDPVITVDNTITNGKHPFLMTWNTLEDDEAGLSLYSQSTAGLSNSMLLKVVMIGAHSNINQTSYAGVFQNLHSGTGSSNVAGEFGAGNAETNYGLQVSAVTGSAASSVNYGVLSTVSGVGTNYGATFDASGGTDNFATWTKAGLIKIESQCLPTGASTDSIMTWEAATGVVRKRNMASITAGSVPISGLTAAAGTNTIDNGNFGQEWDWNSLAHVGLTLNATSTAAADNAQNLLAVSLNGANANSTQKTIAATIANIHTGTASTNIALQLNAASGTNNYALVSGSNSGSYGLGTLTPTAQRLHILSLGTTGTTTTSGVVEEFNSLTTGTGHYVTSNSMTAGNLLELTSTSTALAANNEGLNIGISGANGTNAITATGARISVTNTNGTSGTNIGLDITASGATTANNALNIAAGALTLNGSAGTSGQVLTSAGANTLPTWETPTGGGGSPAGNFGNLQINRNGAFATPGSDSLDFDGGIVMKGKIIVTTTGGNNMGIKIISNSDYAAFQAENDIGTNLYLGVRQSGTGGNAFFYLDGNNSMKFTTNAVDRLIIAGTGETMLSSLYVGSTTTAPTSTLQSGGSFAGAYVAKSANYTATISDFTIECTANTFTVTLPTAVGIAGRIYNIANSGAGVITIGTTSSQTFVNVVATPTTLTLSAVGNYQVQSNGANWLVL